MILKLILIILKIQNFCKNFQKGNKFRYFAGSCYKKEYNEDFIRKMNNVVVLMNSLNIEEVK